MICLFSSAALKPIKERLGLSAGSGTTQPGKKSEKHERLTLLSGKILIMHIDYNIGYCCPPTSPTAETNTESKKAPEQIRIKTLEEIRQEKAAKSQSLSKDGPSVEAPEINNTKPTKGLKRGIIIKDHSISHIKTFSEILRAKKKRQEEEQAKHAVEKASGKSQGESDTAGPVPEALNLGGVRVKTLEEIRREKAARIQAQQALETENKKSCETEENGAKKPRLLRIKKPASQSKTPIVTIVSVFCCSDCVDTKNVCGIVVSCAFINVFKIE